MNPLGRQRPRNGCAAAGEKDCHPRRRRSQSNVGPAAKVIGLPAAGVAERAADINIGACDGNRIEAGVQDGAVRDAAAQRGPRQAVPFGNADGGIFTGGGENASRKQIPAAPRQRIHRIAVDAGAECIPRTAVPTRYLVDGGSAGAGKAAADIEIGAVGGQRVHLGV